MRDLELNLRSGASLLEREGETRALRQALRSARAQHGALVWIEGVGGSGKTSLLAVAVNAAREAGMAVVRARAEQLVQAPAFGVAAELLRRPFADATPDERDQLLRGPAQLARRVLVDADVTPSADRAALAHGLLWVLAHVAEAQPLLVVVDDAQWADPASLEMLVHLADRLDTLPIALLMAARPLPTGEVLDALRDHPAATRLTPRPLTHEGVARLAGSLSARPAAGELVDACMHACGGNPMLTSELLTALAAEPDDARVDITSRIAELAPEAIWRAALSRLSDLPGEAVAVLEALALLAPHRQSAAVAALSGLDEAVVIERIEQMAAVGVLDRNRAAELVHPLLAAAVLERLGPDRLAVARQRAARLLAPDAPELAAAHLLLVEPVGADWVVDALRRAAATAVTHAVPEAAARYLQRALAEPPSPDEAEALRRELARVRGAAGDRRATDDYRAVLAAAQDPADRVDLQRELGHVEFQAGAFSAALAAFNGALDELGDHAPRASSELLADVAMAALLAPQETRVPALARVRAHLSAIDEPHYPGDRVMYTVLASEETLRGLNREHALELGALGWGGGALQADERPEVIGHLMAALLTFADRHEDALEIARAAVRRAATAGDAPAFALASYTRAQTLGRMGRIAEALADLESARDVGGSGWFVGAVGAAYAAAQLERGEEDLARALIHGSVQLSEQDPWTQVVSLELVGDCALALGDTGAAATAYAECGRLHDEVLQVDNPAKSLWRSGLARALSAEGDRDRALQLVTEEEQLAHRWGVGSALGVSRCSRGVILGGDEGVATLREGVDLLAQAPVQLRHAAGLLDLGVAIRRTGDDVAAREPLRAALDRADHCGSVRLASAARAELVAAGGRPRRARSSGVASLTPSELRVVRLAADGLTNRVIAEELFVTTKAVRWHLGHAYRKLGVSDRRQLAEALAEV